MGRHLEGKLVCVLQLIFSVTLLGVMLMSGMLPVKYILLTGFLLVLLLGISFGLQFVKGNGFVAGIIISIISSIVIVFIIFWLLKADGAMRRVGGAAYKTDNMVVVVRASDPAQTLKDAENYRFGKQTVMDVDNTELMVEKINETVGREIKTVDYSSMQELGEALLSGGVEAAIYNEAFTSVLDDLIEDYSSQVRVLYQYGIETKVELNNEDGNPLDKDCFHFYISGIDVAGAITTNSRSDVNIIGTVNKRTKQILLTTTPRDYYVPIPGISGGQRDKLTHAGIYGVDASMATLEELYGIDLAYYARVNFTSLIKIVDTLGGVDVESEYEFSAGGYTFKQGANHLNGEAALAFSRERYSFSAGDNQRGKNQEAVLTAIIRKAMSPAILMNANKLLAQISDSVETNMTSDEMAELIQMQLDDPALWTIMSSSVSGEGGREACFSSGAQQLYVMWPDETAIEAAKAKIQKVMNGETVIE